jgi:hypothetical protein
MKFRGDDIIFGDTLGPRLYLTPRRVLNGARGSHLNRNALSGPGLTTFPWTWPRITQEVHERPDDTHATAAAATAYLRVRLILNLFADLTHILSQSHTDTPTLCLTATIPPKAAAFLKLPHRTFYRIRTGGTDNAPKPPKAHQRQDTKPPKTNTPTEIITTANICDLQLPSCYSHHLLSPR